MRAPSGGSGDGRFIKHNRSGYPDQLLREAHGLAVLRAAAACSEIDVPEVRAVDEHRLVLPRIPVSSCSAEQWAKLGRGLAAIHAIPQPHFGFDGDNYIGGNPQPNAPANRWGQFFVARRLEFQVSLIADPHRRRQYAEILQRSATRLCEFLDALQVTPALVHGDLWHGNVLCGQGGRIWLIDPAPYYGDPEVDLAMTALFGGFAPAFYSAYRALRPEPAHCAMTRTIYNLYHLLNHLNLFGDDYLSGCEAGLEAIRRI